MAVDLKKGVSCRKTKLKQITIGTRHTISFQPTYQSLKKPGTITVRQFEADSGKIGILGSTQNIFRGGLLTKIYLYRNS